MLHALRQAADQAAFRVSLHRPIAEKDRRGCRGVEGGLSRGLYRAAAALRGVVPGTRGIRRLRHVKAHQPAGSGAAGRFRCRGVHGVARGLRHVVALARRGGHAKGCRSSVQELNAAATALAAKRDNCLRAVLCHKADVGAGHNTAGCVRGSASATAAARASARRKRSGREARTKSVSGVGEKSADLVPYARPEAGPFRRKRYGEEVRRARRAAFNPGRDFLCPKVADAGPEVRPLGRKRFGEERCGLFAGVLHPRGDVLGPELPHTIPEGGPVLGQRVGKENLRFAQGVADCIGNCFGKRGAHAVPEARPVLRQRRGEEGSDRLFQVVQGSAFIQSVRKRLADFIAKAQGAKATDTGTHKSADAGSNNRHHSAHGCACRCACANHADLGSALGILVLRVLAGGLGAAVQVSHACTDAQKAQNAAQNACAARCGCACCRGRMAPQGRANGAQGAANATGNRSEGAVRAHSSLGRSLLQELAQPAICGSQALCGQCRRVNLDGRPLKGRLAIAEKPCSAGQGSGRRRGARARDQRAAARQRRAASATRKGRFCCLASLGACLGAKVSRLQNHHLGRYVHNCCGSLERTAHGRHTRRARAGACAASKAKRRGKTAEFRIGSCCARYQLEAENGANGRHLGLVALCPGL